MFKCNSRRSASIYMSRLTVEVTGKWQHQYALPCWTNAKLQMSKFIIVFSQMPIIIVADNGHKMHSDISWAVPSIWSPWRWIKFKVCFKSCFQNAWKLRPTCAVAHSHAESCCIYLIMFIHHAGNFAAESCGGEKAKL